VTPRAGARSYLLTILGELAWPCGGQAWTSSLVEVLGSLGIEEKAARQAIARAAKAGWMTGARHGRSTRWTLTPRLVHAFEEGTARVGSLPEAFDDWDGQWLALVATIPQDQRDARRRLYRRLSWLGMGSPWAGLWVTPHIERAGELGDIVEGLGIRSSSVVITGRVESFGIDQDAVARRSWDLKTLAEDYRSLDRRFSDGPLDTDGLLIRHLQMLESLQQFPGRDPQLPSSLLPDWVGRRTSSRLLSLRVDETARVRARWREIDRSA
jgi:phenylacetic acid degradation operon negative regulatory protein